MPSISDVPAEILQAIFLEAAAMSSESCSYILLPVQEPRVPCQHILLQVCRYWNSLASAMPYLWSDIHIVWRGEGYTSQVVAFARRAIRLSGTLPLDFHFKFRGWYDLADDLLAESHRWREIDFGTSPPTTVQLRALSGRVPKLESITFNHPRDNTIGEAYVEAVSHAFHDAPAFRRLDCNVNLLGARFPWHQLEHFSIPDIRARAPLNIHTSLLGVLSSPSLLKLIIKEVSLPRPFIVRNSNIRELEYHCADDGSWLERLYLPSLCKATLKPSRRRTIEMFTQFVHRSGCRLSDLHYDDWALGWSDRLNTDFPGLFDALPQLASLTLDVSGRTASSTLPTVCNQLQRSNPVLSRVHIDIGAIDASDTLRILFDGVEALNNLLTIPSLKCASVHIVTDWDLRDYVAPAASVKTRIDEVEAKAKAQKVRIAFQLVEQAGIGYSAAFKAQATRRYNLL
ncbi:hypothetical protein CYLTODRAFT_426762 [Cylindrobasidium torrendii FP15055 ss-10]|uniref:Uncharacterized protein n=1 Tax=Cylindrobasidium torrendii FP15055 ss-10 TaxID=1314674 RepID=A0A0D7AW71_9AGAR|nr:hypothetical protein CYLTODRAFT_426762 [Cylindrobasidium torrendii FP15055 ss-10]